MSFIQLGNRLSNKTSKISLSHFKDKIKNYSHQQIPYMQNPQLQRKVTKISQAINPYAFHMTIHLLLMLEINPNLLDFIPNSPYKIVALQILERTLGQFNISQGQTYNFDKEIIYSLKLGINKIKQSTKDGPLDYYSHIQCWYIILIIIFRQTLSIKFYTPYHRTYFSKLFEAFQPYLVQAIRVFRSLQNYYFSLTPNYQKYIPNQGYEILNKHMKNLMIEFYNEQLKRSLNNTYRPQFTMKQVSKTGERKKVVNILISGFLSEQNDKNFQWRGMRSQMPDSQVYALQWQSTQVIQFSKFVFKIPIDIIKKVPGSTFSGFIQDKLNKNPFTDCFKVAQQTGRYLGYLLTKLFPDQFINILGYSLGTQVILTALQQMISRNQIDKLNKIILLGGVTDLKDFINVLNEFKYPVTVINCYTTADMILKYLLKSTMPDLKAIGLNILPQNSGKHYIKNVDVSDFVSGHVSYMLNFDQIATYLRLYHD